MGIIVGSIVLLLLVGVAVALLWALTMMTSLTFGGTKPEDVAPERLLHYRVPEGQDPAVVTSALRSAGFECVVDVEHNHHDVMILCPNGRDEDRSRVRHVIADVHSTSIGEDNPDFVVAEVHFADERPPATM
jgi:hypothetical protein